MLRVLTKGELLNLMAGLPPCVMAMDAEETITTLAATVIEQQAEIERLRDALRKIMGKDGYIDATPRGDRKVMYGEMGLIARTALGATQ